MGEVINLRQVRKAKARAESEQKASVNRMQFGRRKEDKELLRKLDERAEKNLDGHQRED